MVHVHDPRVRWGVPASQVIRIIPAAEWQTGPAVDVLAAMGPVPSGGAHARRVMIVYGVDDRETALLATGTINIDEVDSTAVLPLPDTLAAATPEVSAIVVAQDASLSLLLKPSAVISPDDSRAS
jgi:chemotaxis signal transduction protein